MSSSVASTVVSILQPLVLATIAAGLPYLIVLIRRHAHNRFSQDALEMLTSLASVAASSAFRAVSADDMRTPGFWPSQAAGKARDAAVADIKSIGADALLQLQKHATLTPDSLDALVQHLADQAIAEIKASLPPAAAAVAAVVPVAAGIPVAAPASVPVAAGAPQ